MIESKKNVDQNVIRLEDIEESQNIAQRNQLPKD